MSENVKPATDAEIDHWKERLSTASPSTLRDFLESVLARLREAEDERDKWRKAEREYAKHLAELKAEADAEFPGEDWDPEVYEDYKRVMEKDD